MKGAQVVVRGHQVAKPLSQFHPNARDAVYCSAAPGMSELLAYVKSMIH